MFSPFEQFKVLFLYDLSIGNITFFVSNFTVYNIIVYIIFLLLFFFFYKNIIYKNLYNQVVDIYYSFTYLTINNQVTKKGVKYIPFLQYVFLFIVLSNLLGMIPYSFSITSHLASVFGLSLSIFIGLQIIGLYKFGLYFFNIFLPNGVPLIITPFIVLLELISYIVRVISLSVRLVANIISGHVLLKLIMGFISNMLLNGSFFALAFACVGLIGILVCFEIAIAILQAYVYLVLCAIYLKDVLTIDEH